MTTSQIACNLNHINSRIQQACAHSGRNPVRVKVLLATKTVPAEKIREALRAGYRLIAENRVQELQEKYLKLREEPHISHFIGHLQRNKIKELLNSDVSCIHSIDRFELAEQLDHRLAATGKQMDILIQVNTSKEESKFGVDPDSALELVRRISKLSCLHIKGLMTIGLLSNASEKVRDCFKLLKSIQLEIASKNIPGVHMEELSMGMSGDLEMAIEEGATIIRIGTAVFGQRSTPDSAYWQETSAQMKKQLSANNGL